MRHGEFDPVALSLMKDALIDTTVTKNEGAKRQETVRITMRTEWLQSENARDDNVNEKVTTDQATLEVNGTDHSKKAPNLSSTQKVNPATDLPEENKPLRKTSAKFYLGLLSRI